MICRLVFVFSYGNAYHGMSITDHIRGGALCQSGSCFRFGLVGDGEALMEITFGIGTGIINVRYGIMVLRI